MRFDMETATQLSREPHGIDVLDIASINILGKNCKNASSQALVAAERKIQVDHAVGLSFSSHSSGEVRGSLASIVTGVEMTEWRRC